jgi:NAD(P)-dependent dehydrogenase (short-subunit alcohol dehydrogenase family)
MQAASTELVGKIAFITGGSRGIGAATAKKLASQGATVSVIDRDEGGLAAFMKELGGQHIGVVADVTDSSSLEAAVAETLARLGAIDIVFANAGIGSASTVAASPVDVLARIIEVNLIGIVRTVKATLPALTETRGYFLLMSSAAVMKNVPRSSAYAAAKAGVEAFGGSLRLEVAHKGVGVGIAHPGWVNTDLISAAGSRGTDSSFMPWPFNVKTDVDACAALLVKGISQRRRKVYVPRALAAVDTVRGVFTGRLWDVYMKPVAARRVPLMEAAYLDSQRNTASVTSNTNNP